MLSFKNRKTASEVLTTAGITLTTAGLLSIYLVWLVNFSRYMYIEDLQLGFNDEMMRLITQYSPADKAIFLAGAIIALLGIVAVIAARISARKKSVS
ncbi:hypothetical protein EII31_03970 [Leucobacter sp. OH2974_COT-288]|nr:hypothetical protein EII31_03970 [Leucobacter sp. OH2974_COT-288]